MVLLLLSPLLPGEVGGSQLDKNNELNLMLTEGYDIRFGAVLDEQVFLEAVAKVLQPGGVVNAREHPHQQQQQQQQQQLSQGYGYGVSSYA